MVSATVTGRAGYCISAFMAVVQAGLTLQGGVLEVEISTDTNRGVHYTVKGGIAGVTGAAV